VSRYAVYITPAALREIKGLPGNVRQRVKRAVDALADNLRPGEGKALDMPEGLPCRAWRLRPDK
jgi:mRNA interferase RelE/StbE